MRYEKDGATMKKDQPTFRTANNLWGEPEIRARFPHKPRSTTQALRWSILKWRALLRAARRLGVPIRSYAESCALCELFYEKDCNGCPVFEATGGRECVKSPFQVAAGEGDALAEIQFLQALLWPEKETP